MISILIELLSAERNCGEIGKGLVWYGINSMQDVRLSQIT